jgi:heme exporter protein A
MDRRKIVNGASQPNVQNNKMGVKTWPQLVDFAKLSTAMSTPSGMTVENVHAWRGERHVLRGISLAISPGELLHVAGPNGTGKTTLLKVMTGLMRAEQGEVCWLGESIYRMPQPFQQALAYASHEPALKGDLSALENLQFSVRLKRAASDADLNEALNRCGVAACAHLPARVLSAGQRRRVAMARILAFKAALWLLDEPFTNLDAAGSALLSQLLKDHVAAGGLAAVVAHHDLNVGWPLERLELQ